MIIITMGQQNSAKSFPPIFIMLLTLAVEFRVVHVIINNLLSLYIGTKIMWKLQKIKDN